MQHCYINNHFKMILKHVMLTLGLGDGTNPEGFQRSCSWRRQRPWENHERLEKRRLLLFSGRKVGQNVAVAVWKLVWTVGSAWGGFQGECCKADWLLLVSWGQIWKERDGTKIELYLLNRVDELRRNNSFLYQKITSPQPHLPRQETSS